MAIKIVKKKKPLKRKKKAKQKAKQTQKQKQTQIVNVYYDRGKRKVRRQTKPASSGHARQATKPQATSFTIPQIQLLPHYIKTDESNINQATTNELIKKLTDTISNNSLTSNDVYNRERNNAFLATMGREQHPAQGQVGTPAKQEKGQEQRRPATLAEEEDEEELRALLKEDSINLDMFGAPAPMTPARQATESTPRRRPRVRVSSRAAAEPDSASGSNPSDETILNSAKEKLKQLRKATGNNYGYYGYKKLDRIEKLIKEEEDKLKTQKKNKQ